MDEITKQLQVKKQGLTMNHGTPRHDLLWMDDVALIHEDANKLQMMLGTTNRVAMKSHVKPKCKSGESDESSQHYFGQWVVAYSAHYLNQYWVIVNWTPGNKLRWHFIRNTTRFIHKNASEISSARLWLFCPGEMSYTTPNIMEFIR